MKLNHIYQGDCLEVKEYDLVRTTKEIRTIGGVPIPKGVMGLVVNPADEKDWIDVLFVFKVKRNEVEACPTRQEW